MAKRLVLRWGTLLVVLGLLASACGGRDDGPVAPVESEPTSAPEATVPETAPDGSAPESTAPPETDACDVELEATEIGVSATTIKVIVMADNENPLAAGLFDGARVGAFAWAADLNARGGIACRQVEIEFADSGLNREATVNGFLQACAEALALVGTTVLLGQDTDDLTSCPDQAGNPTGVPDLAYVTTEVAHQCSSTSFHLSRPAASCPYDGGLRDYVASGGAVRWLSENSAEPLHGIILIPGDFQSTRDATLPQFLAHEQVGIVYDGYFGVSGIAPLSSYTPFVQRLRENDSNWIYNGSNDATMINMLQEARNQGLDLSTTTMLCTLSCYTQDFLDQGDLVEGVYVWTFFLPFEEVDTNDDLRAFMTAIDDPFPAAWAAGAWADGKLFELAVNRIVDRDGPNAITRQALIEELGTVTDFDVDGWWGAVDFSSTLTITPCYALLQIQNGEFVRIHPSERGTLVCDDQNMISSSADPGDFEYDT